MELSGAGDIDAAEKYYGEARHLAASLSASHSVLGKAVLGLGRVAAKRGNKEDARQYVDQAIQIFHQRVAPALPKVQQSG